MVMESLSRAVGSQGAVLGLPWDARQALGTAGSSLEPLPGAHRAAGACTAFPTKGGQQALQQAPGPQNLCYPACERLSMAEHKPTPGLEQKEEALWSLVLPAPAQQKGLK